jgi:hypothetical protein
MIARLIRPAQGVNPASQIDGDPAKVTLPDGTAPNATMPPIFTFPVGTILEHPSAWMHCVYGTHNTPPIAEPVDDECRRIVRQHLQRRETDVMNIRETALELDGRGAAGKFMQNLAKSYGVDE